MSDKDTLDKNTSWAERVVDDYVDAGSKLDGAVLGPEVEKADREYAARLRQGDLVGAVGKRAEGLGLAIKGALERSSAAVIAGHKPTSNGRG